MKKDKRILITGCNGLLGQNLIKSYWDYDNIFLTDIHDEPFADISDNMRYISADITDKRSLLSLMGEVKPEIIIHTAAMTDVDACEEYPDKAIEINVKGTENIVNAMPAGCFIAYISTDYVFDGGDGPYSERNKPNPVSIYGVTKLKSEQIILSKSSKSLVIRTVVLYGTGKRLRSFFPDWLISKFEAGKQFNVVDDQISNVTLASNLADICKVLVDNRKTGIYHVSGEGVMSRYEFACMVADYFDYDRTLISTFKTSQLNQKAKRPLKSGFLLDKIKTVHGVKLLDVIEQLSIYKRELKNG